MKKINVTETITTVTETLANTLMLHELKAVWMAIDAKGMGGAISLYERKLAHWTVEDGKKVWAEYKTALDYVKGVQSLFVRIQARTCISIVEMTKALAVGLRFIWGQLSMAVVTVATVVKQGLKTLFALIKKGLNKGKTLLEKVFHKDDDDDIVIEVEEEKVKENKGDNTPCASTASTPAPAATPTTPVNQNQSNTPNTRIVRVYQPTNPDDITHNLIVGAMGGVYTSSKEMEITFSAPMEGTDEEILDLVFAMANHGKIPVHHDISCGDVVGIGRTFYRCLPIGWDKLN